MKLASVIVIAFIVIMFVVNMVLVDKMSADMLRASEEMKLLSEKLVELERKTTAIINGR